VGEGCEGFVLTAICVPKCMLFLGKFCNIPISKGLKMAAVHYDRCFSRTTGESPTTVGFKVYLTFLDGRSLLKWLFKTKVGVRVKVQVEVGVGVRVRVRAIVIFAVRKLL
jgi:hypothetical protein